MPISANPVNTAAGVLISTSAHFRSFLRHTALRSRQGSSTCATRRSASPVISRAAELSSVAITTSTTPAKAQALLDDEREIKQLVRALHLERHVGPRGELDQAHAQLRQVA